jgi:hypothetical protein
MISALVLVFAVVAYRVAAGCAADSLAITLANFTPLAALALCAGVYFPRKWALLVPVLAQLSSDAILAAVKGTEIKVAYVALISIIYVAIASAGLKLRRQFSVPRMLLGTVGAVILFQTLLNTASFLADPAYAKTFAGWIQAQTTGTPGFPPTWMFTLKSLVGNLAFTGLFLFLSRPQATGSELLPVPALK